MSRERDSEIIYELVTSKYKIAERNRLAKIRFLNSMNDNSSSTATTPLMPRARIASDPQVSMTERVKAKAVDLSVPGTPVSSRYIKALRKGRVDIETDSEDEKDDEVINKDQQQQQLLLEEGLKQFTSDMENLQKEKSHDPIKEYFDKADKSKSYKREFSEVVQEFEVNKPPPSAILKVEKYFKESTGRGSLTREFSEVVQEFDPQNPSGREQFKSLTKPGTPISSKFIKVEKVILEPFTDNIKKLEKLLDDENNMKSPRLVKQVNVEPPEKPKRANIVPPTPTVTPPTPTTPTFPVDAMKSDEKIIEKVESKSEIIDIETALKIDPQTAETVSKNISLDDDKTHPKVDDKTPQLSTNATDNKQPEKKLKRISSNHSISSTRSDISVPGTPVDSRHIFKTNADDDTDSDIEIIESSEIKALAQEFSEKIGELTQKSENEEKKLSINYDDKTSDSESISRVKDYLERSEKEKTYQRPFSEVANFNEPSLEVKQKVEKFFKDSDEKKTFTRGFSEAINYVEPVNIEELFIPGTPVSSKTVQCLKKQGKLGDDTILEADEVNPELIKGMGAFLKAHNALHNSYKDFKADKYFEESKERKTLRRDFSEVLGTVGEPLESHNPDISKYFEQSEAQKHFHRQFSDAIQTLPPRMKDILIEQAKKNRKTSRASSVSSASEIEGGKKKKYTVDKYFAASLYRTAYARHLSERRGSEPNHNIAIVEDEYVFGETDVLRSKVFQDDDSTPIHLHGSENYEQQNVEFWREFLKPYNLNLPTDIVMRDELIDKYAKYTLE